MIKLNRHDRQVYTVYPRYLSYYNISIPRSNNSRALSLFWLPSRSLKGVQYRKDHSGSEGPTC